MLSTLEANFIQEYKVCGSGVQALKNIGIKLPDASLKVKAHRWLKRPEIKSVIDNYRSNTLSALVNPVITKIPESIAKLPDKMQYAITAWQRASDESQLKQDTKFKYFENTGKVLGFVNDKENNNESPVINIVAADLHLSLTKPDLINNQIEIKQAQPSPPGMHTPQVCGALKVITTTAASVVSAANVVSELNSEGVGGMGETPPATP